MSDKLEQRLERLYRSLDRSALRVQAGWRTRPGTRRRATGSSRSIAAWGGAGIAAAAAIFLMVLSLQSEPKPLVELAKAPAPAPEPPRILTDPFAPIPAPPPRPAAAAPPAPAPAAPTASADPAPEAPGPHASTVPAPAPPAPARELPVFTRAAAASFTLRETEGSFDLADRGGRGKQKDVTVSAGERLRATTLVKLTLAEDRFVLLAPKTVLEFRPDEKRLTLSLEQGEALATLAAPGLEIRIVTKSCEVAPLGAIFAVKVVPGRSIVTVEKGRVEIRSAKGKATLRAAESLQAAEDGTLGSTSPADFRSLAWARSHRPAESTLYAEDFSKPGAWEGEIGKGIARAAARPGSAPLLHVASDQPLFEIPVRGVLSVVCRADRASRLKVQIFAGDVRTTYKIDVPVLRSTEWRTLNFSVDDFVPTDRTKASGRPAPGAPITDLLFQYGDEEERGSFWVESLRMIEWRP
ncbi:MAG TPA: FecR domain-containing protein [Planctomycetota bacterium]|nr:FecR domain-containing protein [Planctomycetota bacterium]